MPQTPDGKSTRVDAPLTNVSVAYAQQNNYLATRVFPEVSVQRQGDLYWKYNRGDWQRGQAELRAPGTESSGGGWRVSTDSYYAHVYAVHKDLDDQTVQNASNDFNLEADATRWVTDQLMIKRDALWNSTYFKASLWTGGSEGHTLTKGNGFAGGWIAGAGTPILDIRNQRWAMREDTGYFPNTLVLGAQLYVDLLDHPDIIERVQYVERGIVGTDLLSALFDGVKVIVADNVASSGNLDATVAPNHTETALAYMSTKEDALLCYAAPRAGLNEVSAGYTFAWTGLLGAGAMGARMKRFRMEEIESVRIEGEMAFALKVVALDLGVYFDDVHTL